MFFVLGPSWNKIRRFQTLWPLLPNMVIENFLRFVAWVWRVICRRLWTRLHIEKLSHCIWLQHNPLALGVIPWLDVARDYFDVPHPFHDIWRGIGAWHRPYTDLVRFHNFTLNLHHFVCSLLFVFCAVCVFCSHFHVCGCKATVSQKFLLFCTMSVANRKIPVWCRSTVDVAKVLVIYHSSMTSNVITNLDAVGPCPNLPSISGLTLTQTFSKIHPCHNELMPSRASFVLCIAQLSCILLSKKTVWARCLAD